MIQEKGTDCVAVADKHAPMGSIINPHPVHNSRYSKLIQSGHDLLHDREAALDKLEEFAANLGPKALRDLDGGFLLMTGGICALILLFAAL